MRSRISDQDLATVMAANPDLKLVREPKLRALPVLPDEPAPTKFRNKPTTVEGIRFDSKREAARWQVLKLLEQAGAISSLERQVKYPLVVNEQKICTYIADFTYLENSVAIVEDCKGVRTPTYKLKQKLMRALHGIEIRET